MAVLRKVDGEIIITDKDKDVLLTADELAERFDVAVRTIWRYRDAGMPFTKFGRFVMFSVDECRAWINSTGKMIPSESEEYAFIKQRIEQKKAITRAKTQQRKEQE